ncbi:hypothetical protein DFR43_11256 [Tepidicella xavieri]|jgi:hypothetical protein|uniref:Chemotaxis protein CheZ n=2 Tax=Tepidicella xavieri TaxID=360241 RepID=A0A4R6U986_9BURK|nr:hypothetical protein DFR43_11256 [Tepidicella xavieri]
MENPTANPQDKRRWPREEYTTVEPVPSHTDDEPAVAMDVAVVADLQDSLLVAMNDLKRLEGLLDHATVNLLDRFNRAMQVAGELPDDPRHDELRQALHLAVTELQFHDMATQLLVHIGKVLKGCAYILADQAMEPEEEEVGIVVTHMPKNPNPVTQSEMDAGSIELF